MQSAGVSGVGEGSSSLPVKGIHTVIVIMESEPVAGHMAGKAGPQARRCSNGCAYSREPDKSCRFKESGSGQRAGKPGFSLVTAVYPGKKATLPLPSGKAQ